MARRAILFESHYRAWGHTNESARDFIHVAQRGGELHGGEVVLEVVSRALSHTAHVAMNADLFHDFVGEIGKTLFGVVAHWDHPRFKASSIAEESQHCMRERARDREGEAYLMVSSSFACRSRSFWHLINSRVGEDTFEMYLRYRYRYMRGCIFFCSFQILRHRYH